MRTIRNLSIDRQELFFERSYVANAINNVKPLRPIGPDGLSMIMLKKLGERAIRFPTRLLDLSLHNLVIPDVWKVARIIPILKPNKPATKEESYRPISLLSSVVKIQEALLLRTFKEHFPLAEHQHGFRKVRSTTTVLTEIISNIANGLN